jgi:hypothetical protein
MKPLLAIFLSLALLSSGLATAETPPAQMISGFPPEARRRPCHHGCDAYRIALEQAKAMAAKDTLDHAVLGSFSSRIAPARSARAAENIAYGYDSFEKTLDQWIASTGHRDNLLLHNVSGRHHQCRKRHLSSYLLGNGDRGRLWATSDSRKQGEAGGGKKKIACPILSSQSPRDLLLTRRSGRRSEPSANGANGLPVDAILCCDPTSFVLVAFAACGAPFWL